MTWKTPKIVEVQVGMEINMYVCASRKEAKRSARLRHSMLRAVAGVALQVSISSAVILSAAFSDHLNITTLVACSDLRRNRKRRLPLHSA